MHDDKHNHDEHGGEEKEQAATCTMCGHKHKEDGTCDCGCTMK